MSPKELILTAAVKNIAKNGFFDTTATVIAKEAQISLSTFYDFYTDEAEIMEEIFALEFQKRFSFYVNIKNWHMDWFLKINGILNFHLREIEKDPELATIIITEKMNPYFRQTESVQKFKHLSSIVAEILQQAVKQNKIHSCNVEATSLIILGFVDTLTQEYLLTHDLKRLEQTIDNFCQLLKNSLEIIPLEYNEIVNY